MAAALFESLPMNHPFVDGNKRVTFFATDVFLRLNGWKMNVEAPHPHREPIGMVESGACDFEHIEPWIRRSVVRLGRQG